MEFHKNLAEFGQQQQQQQQANSAPLLWPDD